MPQLLANNHHAICCLKTVWHNTYCSDAWLRRTHSESRSESASRFCFLAGGARRLHRGYSQRSSVQRGPARWRLPRVRHPDRHLALRRGVTFSGLSHRSNRRRTRRVLRRVWLTSLPSVQAHQDVRTIAASCGHPSAGGPGYATSACQPGRAPGWITERSPRRRSACRLHRLASQLFFCDGFRSAWSIGKVVVAHAHPCSLVGRGIAHQIRAFSNEVHFART